VAGVRRPRPTDRRLLSRETDGTYLDRWAARLQPTPKSKPATILACHTAVRLRFAVIRALALSDLRPDHLTDLLGSWQTEGLALATRVDAWRVLRLALKDAVRARIIPHNPTADVDAPNVPRQGVTRGWDEATLRRFLVITDATPDGLLWWMICRTLIREGELAALRWSDLDWASRDLHLQRTLTWTTDGWIVGDRAKTYGSNQKTLLPADLVERLRTYKADQKARRLRCSDWPAGDLRFDDGTGFPLTAAMIYHRFMGAGAAAEVPRTTPHGLHHTGATLMATCVPLTTASKLLGDASPWFTAQLYVQPGSNEQAAVVETLDPLLADG
jgi:integrase